MRKVKYLLFLLIVVLIPLLLSQTTSTDKNLTVTQKKDDNKIVSEIYPNRHALCIGINDYQSPGIPDLQYAENDANEMARILKELYAFDDVTLLLGSQATQRNISKAIGSLQNPKRIGDKDCVLIYFSGHGQTVSTGRRDDGYIIPQDAQISLKEIDNPAPYKSDCIRMEDIKTDLDAIPALHVLFIADACYSGYIASKSLEDAPDIAGALKYSARQVITAGTKGEQTIESNAWRHGVFTYKILEILKVEEKPIQASALGVMLKQRVPREVSSQYPNRILTPQAKYLSGDGDFIFIRKTFSIDNLNTYFQLLPKPAPLTPQKSNLDAQMKLDELKNFLNKNNYSLEKQISYYDSFIQDWSATKAATEAMEIIQSLKQKLDEEKRFADYSEDLGNGVKLEMVAIKGGSFQMGSPSSERVKNDDECPVHTVELDGFWIGKYEVTQEQWQAVMGNNPSYFKGDNLPVEEVSGDDAMEFCKKLSEKTGKTYTLPSEAQWEYACRAGSKTRFCFGDYGDDLGEYAWYWDNSNKQTNPVGQKKPNDWGLYDMHGNVWEWCLDWYDDNYYSKSPSKNPVNLQTSSYRVMRGGSWPGMQGSCRSAHRYRYNPVPRDYDVGFRVERTLD